MYQHVGNAKIVGKNGEYTYANVNYDILGLIVEKYQVLATAII